MKKILLLCLFPILALAPACNKLLANTAPASKSPVNIIFDCDMGNDMDDAMALAILHALETRGECKLLAVTTTKGNALSAPVIDLINTFYGRSGIPIGVVKNGPTPNEGAYLRGLLELEKKDGAPAFNTTHPLDHKYPNAVTLLRETLAAAADQSIVIVQVGFFTNLGRLLQTQPDKISPLSGRELVAKKVRLVSLMAGAFRDFESPIPDYSSSKDTSEYNVRKDIPSAAAMARDWPTEMVFCGLEVGSAILFPPESLKKDFDYVPFHPIKEGKRFFHGLDKPQRTFDLNSALYAVRSNANYYQLSEPGIVTVAKDGRTLFRPDPAGKHRFMIVNARQAAAVQKVLVELTSQKP